MDRRWIYWRNEMWNVLILRKDKWVHLCHHYHVVDRKPAALAYFNFQSNVQCPKRNHRSCITALSLPKDQTWVCAAESPRLCHPSFLHLSFSLSFLPLPITWLVTGLCFCPLLLISPCIYTCSTEAALAFFQISFPDILVCFLLPQNNVSVWKQIYMQQPILQKSLYWETLRRIRSLVVWGCPNIEQCYCSFLSFLSTTTETMWHLMLI